ncbi:C-X-C motif chemokine 11-6 [Ictalurus punctatus]|uniref:C-X-C motif chemokine 11-6 n=1 Tax=Ictalurus punctatus TaxID=7998 RepID=A0A2D0PMU3_ICTPU|nr:C-X-C motif chemokine 11-6 [Ictalurus punctatus]XP_053466213.1 C-X-C motif chemokine 11-6-like [Ictalurus furcatus]
MKMKSAAVFVVIACLLIAHVEGVRTSVRRCLCQGHGANGVRVQRIDKIEVYPASASCENVEIIVVLKNGAGKKCLNPESSLAKNYINKVIQKRRQLQENSTH